MLRAFLVLCALCALAAAPAHAGDLVAAPVPSPAWALQFGVSGTSLTTFDGGTLSLRHQCSPHAAWRYGLNVNGGFAHDQSSGTADASSAPPPTDDDRQNSMAVSAQVTRLTCPAPDALIKPYFGIGLGAGWAESLTERTITTRNADGTPVIQAYDSSHSWGPTYTALALFGIEWVFDPRFSVHAEYGQGASYSPSHFETQSRRYDSGVTQRVNGDGTSRTWSVNQRSVHAGLSVFY